MSTEASATFGCFGSRCGVWVGGDSADAAVALAERSLLDWHHRFSRFEPASELSRVNADPRDEVPASPLMLRLALTVRAAAQRTDGLVDATLIGEIEAAGYTADLPPSLPLPLALRLAPRRRPAAPRPDARWRALQVDIDAGVIRRPPGLRLDSGGLAKGMFADVLAERLAGADTFAIDCAGDVRVGGRAGVQRPVQVTSPFDGAVIHSWPLAAGAAATSGIGRRSWMDARGRVAHHLLDPATGRPAYTGIVQVTAIAPTAARAEERAKHALLRGPETAAAALPGGGLIVLDDGRCEIVAPRDGAPSATMATCDALSSPRPLPA